MISDERAAVVAWLRKHTHLNALADAIQAGIHHMPERWVRDYCKRRNLKIREVGK